MNELPRHLVTDLEVNSDGWLISKHEKEQKNETTNSSSFPPVVLHACTKLLALIFSQDTKNGKDEQKDNEKNDGPINSSSSEKEDDITNLRHVPNIADQMSAVFHQIHKMTCIQPQEEPIKEEVVVEEVQQSNSQDSWSAVGKQDSSNVDKEPVYYKEPSERMHLTFNTLQVILPILQPVVTHKDHNNYELKMKNGPNIRRVNSKDDANNKKTKRVRKSTVYLFFEEQGVYSTSTTKQFNSLSIEYQEIVSYMYRFYRRNKGMPYHYDVNSTSMDNVISSNILSELFPTSIPTPQEIIAKTLMTTLDPTMMKFADEMDEKIIHPLALDRYDMHRHHRNSIVILKNRLQKLISNVFKGAVLEVYGSCLSELSLGKSSDVDLSLFIPQMLNYQQQYKDGKIEKTKYQQHMKKTVFRLAGIFRSRSDEGNTSKVEFTKCEAIPYARVPVVKGNYLHANNPFSTDGSLHFDICILNDIAVRNSGLLKAYSTMDLRVKMLMLSIKSWIKHHDIGSAADNTLSSYTWMIMTIFYLQCIGFVPNLQCPVFMEKHDLHYDPQDRMHTVNGLKTVYLTSEEVHKRGIWEQPEEFRATPVSCLLAGFFHFYARDFPHETTAISIRLGNLSLQKTVFKSSRFWRFVIEDPFETHDSHCPHDLAIPMDENGNKRVMNALCNAADRTEQLFIDCDKVKDIIGSYKLIHRDSNEEDAADIMDLLDNVTMWDAVEEEKEEEDKKDTHKRKKGRNRNRNKKKGKGEEKKDKGSKTSQKKSEKKVDNSKEGKKNEENKGSKEVTAPSPKRRQQPMSSLQSAANEKKDDQKEVPVPKPKQSRNQGRMQKRRQKNSGAKDTGKVPEES